MGVKVRFWHGKWYIFINVGGRRKAKAIGDRKTAELVAEKIRARLALGDFQIDQPQRTASRTFEQTAENWLDRYARRHCAPATYAGYRYYLRTHAYALLGPKPFDDVTRDDVEDVINAMIDQGLAKGTIKWCVNAIRAIYNHAIDHGAKLINPAARMGRFLSDKTAPAVKFIPLTAEEVQCLLDGAEAIDLRRAGQRLQEVAPSFYLFLLTAVRTGLRLGELMGLQWGDLDFQGRFIEVRRQWNRGRLILTKSRRVRRVDMSLQLRNALRDAKESRRTELAIQGRELDPQEPIFRNAVGGRLQESNVRRRLVHPCCQEAGLRQIHPHLLRHTFASLLLQNGESIAYVKDQLGHASIQLTVDTYGHLIPGANKAAVDRLDTATIRNPRATTRDVHSIDALEVIEKIGDPSGTRTRDSLLKRQELCRLS